MENRRLSILLAVMSLWVGTFCAEAQKTAGKVTYLVIEDYHWQDSSSMPEPTTVNSRVATLCFNSSNALFVEKSEGVALNSVMDIQNVLSQKVDEAVQQYEKDVTPISAEINFAEEDIYWTDRQKSELLEIHSEQNVLSKQPVAGREPLQDIRISWHLLPETRKIGSLLCKKAVGVFRGRTYEAWYAPQIPVPYGPWKLQGLPGLIIEAYDASRQLNFMFVRLQMGAVCSPSLSLSDDYRIVSRQEMIENEIKSLMNLARMLVGVDGEQSIASDMEVSIDEEFIEKGQLRERDEQTLSLYRESMKGKKKR